jgi:hypothetical protein
MPYHPDDLDRWADHMAHREALLTERADHSHECRDCGAEIDCTEPCEWQGSNDGCDCEES